MHRALAITELLTHILRDVYNDDEGLNLRRGIKDMARISQVCKTFRDPALDFLWKNLDSLLPLLRLLPLEINEEHGDKARLSKVLGDLKSTERQCYISISNRVRTLSFSEPHEPIPRNLINDIIEYNLLLTPRIDVLHLRISSEAGLRLLPALITPELTDISLSFDENLYVFNRPLDLGDLIKSVYMTIFRCAPKLAHFSVVDLYEALPLLSLTKDPGQDHMDMACLQSLTHAAFYITAASLPQVLDLMSQLRKLEDLTIQVCEKPFEEIPRLSSASETFGSLKSVAFDGPPDIISRIFSAFPANRSIQSVILRMHGLYTNADIALVLSGVVAAVSKESLQKIIITSVLSKSDLARWDADSGIDTHQFILDIHAIEPALQFRNLEIFSACLGVPLYLTDEDHLRIAQTWRSVQLLYLSSIVQRVVLTYKPPASIASLVHYARYCRRLKALGLCLDASTKASVDACIQAVDNCEENIPEENHSLPSPSIQMVEFGPSWLECNFDPVHINSLAKAFTRLFSNLAACRACRTEVLGVPQAAWTWMKVQTLYEYILFTDQGCNVNTPRSAWKLRLFSTWTSDYGKDYEKVALAAPGSSVEVDFDDDQNAEAFNQIMYKTARDELAKISKEHEVM
ncbi:uncharacterized protein F5147DRAFT_840590 [Suillus discolor]|uniref:F-box domain-containing protein n=1 Tax=Suillus discolor TaxID=1912936 RepID=A0A9P7JNR3_9AGAM|nr:uncharacterized protein F5147DRAFT_840590 [Suillus discolor]KAG2092637.1 hypothetical protein F5147DRAFT_840590 [Suillus discolor]